MKTSLARLLLAAAVPLAGCGDGRGTAPRDPLPQLEANVRVEGPRETTGAFDGNTFGCQYPIRAVGTGDAGAVAVWGALRAHIDLVREPYAFDDTVAAEDVHDMFGSDQIRPGEVQEAVLGTGFVFDEASDENAYRAAHRVTWSFEYRSRGVKRVATYTVDCTSPELPPPPPPPPPPPEVVLPTGRYVLVTLDGQLLPWSSVSWTVHADTLEFFPDTTYTTTSLVSAGGGGPYLDKSPRQRYEIVGVDSFRLPSVVQGAGTTDPVVRSGSSLQYLERNCCGRPDVLWRFEPEGTPPPARPSMIASSDLLTFTAVRRGPLPPEQQIEVRSSTDLPITDVNVGMEDGTPPGVPWSVGIVGNTTPSIIQAQPLTTDVPAGTYRLQLLIISERAANSPVFVEVEYRVTEP